MRSLSTSCLFLSTPCMKTIHYVTQTQSNKKLNPKISQAFKHSVDLGFLPFFIRVSTVWKSHWLFKYLRNSAVFSCKPLPSNPNGLMHDDHRYKLFAGSGLGSSCQSLSTASLGALKKNNSPSLKSACTFTGVWSRMNETSERGRLCFPS